ncbi:MAG TPA: hypothetical protein VHL11_06115 [Phototrophicaceae bacterium]|jgi:hypothetical protein|nr:hypothetical protein [Phototrophicaceae bacterium]
MPVLLLAYGDPKAKDLLRRAIEARYGVRPPALEALKLDFKGRARAKIGPVTAWVPVEATAFFQFPTAMRWDFVVKPLGLPVQRGVESFHDNIYRVQRGKAPMVMTDEAQIAYLRRRLWAVAAMLLTPLGEDFVKISLDESAPRAFQVTNTRINDTVSVYLRPDYTVESVQVECLNPETERQQRFIMRLSEAQIELNEFIMPKKIDVFWDNEPSFEIEPTRVESNPALAASIFTMDSAAQH